MKTLRFLCVASSNNVIDSSRTTFQAAFCLFTAGTRSVLTSSPSPCHSSFRPDIDACVFQPANAQSPEATFKARQEYMYVQRLFYCMRALHCNVSPTQLPIHHCDIPQGVEGSLNDSVRCLRTCGMVQNSPTRKGKGKPARSNHEIKCFLKWRTTGVVLRGGSKKTTCDRNE